ncbi:FUSC family protein, partial [Clavibacter lycopersici]
DRALDRLRRTQPLVDAWSAAADSALSIARISPFLRRHLPELRAQRRVLDGMDLAVRNLRVISRRIDFLVVDGVRRPVLAELLATVSNGVNLLGQSLSDPSAAPLAQQNLVLVAVRLDPRELIPGAPVGEVMLVMLLRPLLVDLQVAAGVDADTARRALPAV